MELTLSRRVFVVLSIALLQWNVGNSLDITVANGGYGNVVVAIGNDLNTIECENYIIRIKAMMESASTVLYTATGNRMFFSNVTIVIPSNWTCDGEIVEDSPIPLAFEDAHIRVQTSHPFFADNPWTQQPGGCKDPGEYMYFSNGFLSDTSHALGDHGTVFVHEWAKFRWGVFEEYGHAGDSVFPSAYRNNSSVFQPNYCTNGRIDGNFGPFCSTDDQEADCTFTPTVTQTGNATSSLLAVPFTSTVNTFCHSSNHDTTLPTKQNLMCNKKSTWDVIALHNDITKTTPSTNKENTTYSIQRMDASTPQHRIVFLLDVTKKMDGEPSKVYSRWAYVRDAVRQFIRVRAAEGSQVAVIHFGTAPPLPQELTTLNSTNRDDLAKSVQESPGSDTRKVVALAISAAAETLGSSGQIILITESLTEHTGEDSKTWVENAKGLAVLPILYPYNPDVDITLYESVAQVAGLVPQTVNNTLSGGSVQAVDCLFDITQLIQSAGRDTLTLVQSETFEEKWPLSLQLTVENATSYESQYFVEVLLAFPSQFLVIEIKDPSGFVLSEERKSDSSRIYLGDALQDGIYTINSNYPMGFVKAYASIYAIPQNTSASQPYNIVVSASKPLNNLEYSGTPPTAPIIYAMLSDGIRPIVFAEVTATIKNVLSSGSINNFTLTLSDNGVGGDVTGNDGTYSSYLVGIEEVGTVAISISASDNNGSARLVGSTTLNSAPVNPSGLQRSCCGSSLILTDDLLVDAGKFSIGSAPGINGQATGKFPRPNAYPPGRVTDLKGSQVGNKVNLAFTATGEDFNIGQATSYIVKNGMDAAFTQELNISVDAGTVISTSVGVECGKRYSLTVEAVDRLGTRSDPSNEVHGLYSCVVNPNGLSTGAIVGITLGVLFFVLLLVLIACSYKNRDSLKDSKLCQMMTCQCLKKKKTDKDKKSSHLVTSRTGKDSDFIRSNPAPRSINSSGHIRASAVPAPARRVEDLYRNSDGKRREESDSDGGFGDRRMQQGNVQMSDLRQSDESSEVSSVASRGNPRIRPSNRVGIPLANSPAQFNRAAPSIPVQAQRQYNPGYGAHDNNSYNDSESGVYSVSNQANFNKRHILPPLQPRNNTQV